MVGALSGVGAQTYPTIERDRAEPDRPAICSSFRDQPQADVVSLVRALAIRLLESELFLFPLIIERADRRIVVWPVKHHATDDLDTRAQRDWVGREPAGRVHGADHILLAANKSNIKRIPRNAAPRRAPL